ncbi:MAG: O-antigen ligase family protein [Kiloniellales bacterium]
MAYISRAQADQRLAPWIGSTTGDPLGLWLLAMIYVKVFFNFTPFQRDGISAVSEGGSTTNQLYWLGIMAFACFVIWRNWGTAMELLRRSWIYFLPIIWFAVTILWSPEEGTTLRRSILMILMSGVAFGVAAARPSPRDFLNISALVIGAILFFSVLSIFLVPHLGRSPGGQFLGIYNHKNGAGYVAAMTFLFWIFLVLSTLRFEMKIIALFASFLWLFFLVGTLSKTSLGLALVTPLVGISLYYVLQLDLQWRVISYVAGTVLFGVMVWAVLYINWTIEDIGILIFDDLTFTSRTMVWEYVIRSIEERPLLGHGYGSFWKTADGLANRLGAEKGSGWAQTVGSAHNGYLNVWLETGLIGLLLCVTTMVIVFRRILMVMKQPAELPQDRWVYATLLSITVFLYLHATMESSLYMAHSGSTILFFMVAYLVTLWRWQAEELQVLGAWEARRLSSHSRFPH